MNEAFALCLRDRQSTDICVNGGRIFVDRGTGLIPEAAVPIDPQALKAWLLDALSLAGKSWDARVPFVDAPWVFEGMAFRLHAVLPPVSESGILVSIRRIPGQHPGSQERAAHPAYPQLLAEAVARGETVLISGATGSGKTSLSRALLEHVPAHERVIALEDTPELRPDHPHFVSLQSRPSNADGFGEITLRSLFKQTLRMRPDRIVLGECRGAEVLELLQSINTGHRGSMATIHANSPRDALRRIEILALLSAGEALPRDALREWVAAGLDWLVHVARLPDGSRRVRQIERVAGIEAGTILLRPVDWGGSPVL